MSHPVPRVLVALATAAAAALFAGCSLLNSDAPRDQGGQVTAAADAGAMSVRLGDCIGNVADLGGQVETVPVAPCSDPHQGEVYAEKALTDNKLPDDIEGVADEFCMGEILDFLGGDPAEKYPDLSVMYLHPTPQSWLLGDKLVQCIVYSEAGGLTGSLKGAVAS